MSKADKRTECVRVVIRCRPLSAKEMNEGNKVVVQVDEKRGEIVVTNPFDTSPRTFTFDQTYNFDARQERIFNETAWPIIENVLEGYNGTIFAYGQTGTGKTHTMEGQVSNKIQRGIMPRSFESIFDAIEDGDDKQYLVRCTYLELYNEEVRDLLGENTEKKLELHEHPETGVYVKGISEPVIKTPQDLLNLQAKGASHRIHAETEMNRNSSRSHSIFSINIETSEQDGDGVSHIRAGKLNMVDLAGSERQKKTNATGDRLKEAININISLTTLGHVIYALVDKKATHVPYRDSKLTRLLQDSLGGNTKTVMIANIGPADYNYDETINTLRYASNAKMIKNKPKINEDPKDALLREYQEEIHRLRAQLGDVDPGSFNLSENLQAHGVIGKVRVIEIKKVKVVEDEEKTKEMMDKLQKESEQIHAQTEAEIESIKHQKNMKENEKEQLIVELRKREEMELKNKEKKKELLKTVKVMEGQIMQGKTAEKKIKKDREIWKRKMKELQEKREHDEKLRRQLQEKEDARLTIERKFNNQQDELEDKNERLQTLWRKYQESKALISDLSEEFQHEREEMMDTIRELMRQIKLKAMVSGLSNTQIIQHFVPPEETRKIERRKEWNEEQNDFILKPQQIVSSGGVQGVEVISRRVKRPTSAVGLKRPTSEYTRINKGLGQLNPRYKAENILQLDLDYAERTTEDFVPGKDSDRVQNAIASVLQEHEEAAQFQQYLPFEEADAVEEMMRQKKQRVKSAKRPGTAKRKKAPPSATSTAAESSEGGGGGHRKGLVSDKRKL